MINETDYTMLEDWSGFVKMALRDEPYSAKIIFSVSLLIVFVASLVGNILTCIVIYHDKTMHTATNYYLFNLAISDLLVTVPILLIVYQLLIQESDIVEFKHGVFSCKFFLCIHFIFVTLLWNNGILVMTVLSIERYIAICYPMMLKGTPVWRRVGKIIVTIWTIAIIETLPQLWTLEVIDTDKSLMCFSLPTPTARIITGSVAVVTFIVPLGIMMFVYTMIAFKVNDNPKYDLKNTVYNNGFRRKNVNKLIALTVSFVVCWLPFFLIRMIMFATDVRDLSFFHRWFATAHKIAMFNSWFTTVLNPLLFSLMSIKFRKALKTLWERKVQKRYFRAKKSETADTQLRKSTSCYLVE
ncbi:neuromedin-U receptor 1-like isoform X2 [Anticarsia gemmatalis]|uniref:neuromedin-U receptor 1-like isoform X2 n=1 Tax=Anticarsia gemmatalis TaxID=129554 RepID=UPI003F769ACE